MQDLVAKLKKMVRFKETTGPGDIVLVAGENPQMLFYALVGNIEPDTSRRDSWWHLKMKVLSVPPREITWTLREPQFTGREIFTMGGDKRFVQAIDLDNIAADDEPPHQDKEAKSSPSKSGLRRMK